MYNSCLYKADKSLFMSTQTRLHNSTWNCSYYMSYMLYLNLPSPFSISNSVTLWDHVPFFKYVISIIAVALVDKSAITDNLHPPIREGHLIISYYTCSTPQKISCCRKKILAVITWKLKWLFLYLEISLLNCVYAIVVDDRLPFSWQHRNFISVEPLCFWE